MGLGFSKSFIIFIFLSIILSIGTNNYKNGIFLMVIYVGVKIIINILCD